MLFTLPLSLLHLLAKLPGPAVIRLAADDFARNLVEDDALAHLADGGGLQRVAVVVIAAVGGIAVGRLAPLVVDCFDVPEEILDRLGEGLVGWAGGKLERLDQVRLHRLGRVWCEVREPVGGWKVVPRHGRIAVHGRDHERDLAVAKLSGLACRSAILLLLLRVFLVCCGIFGQTRPRRRLSNNVPQFVEEGRGKIALFVPKVNQVLELLRMLGGMLESSGTMKQGREARLQGLGAGIVVLTDGGVVEDIVEQV